MAGITTYTPPNRVGDVFGLTTVYERQVQNVESGNFYSWDESATYGYFAGGSNSTPIYLCTISRIDFSSETGSSPNNGLPSARGYLNAVSSRFYGYFGGSSTGTGLSVVERLDISTETTSLPGKNLPSSMVGGKSSLSNNSYGYFGGSSSLITACNIIRFDFSNETASEPGSYRLGTQSATVSSNSYGYFAGGYQVTSPPTYINTITRLDFSNETTSNPNKNLDGLGRYQFMGLSGNSYGYFGGGTTPIVNTIERIDFSTEVTNLPSKNLPSVVSNLGAVSSNSYGYFSGGTNPVGPVFYTNIIRLDFSNENISTPGSNLYSPLGCVQMGTVSGGAAVSRQAKTYGYFTQGAGSQKTIYRLNFSTETVTTYPNRLTYQMESAGAFSNNYYAYIGGGVDLISIPSPSSTCYILRFDFSNESVNTLSNSFLPSARRYVAGTSSNSYGYFVGGTTPAGTICTIDRFDFSTETVTTLSARYPSTQRNAAGTSSSSYGYFAGNSPALTVGSDISRLDFSVETLSTSSPSRRLTANVSDPGATSSNLYGYFAGGVLGPNTNGITTISRLDFSSDTVTSNNNNNLPSERDSFAGTSSNAYGYFAGGNQYPSPAPVSCTITRLDFSNETISASGNNLPSPVRNLAAFTASN